MKITTKTDIIKLFHKLGMRRGHNVMVHSSLRSLGYVVNGAMDVIDALIETVGEKKGTILMPSHTGQLTDPIDWKNPSIPKKDINRVRKAMTPFYSKTPIRNRGIIPEKFLWLQGIYRSDHPLNSVIAYGKEAQWFTLEHFLHESESYNSPIHRLYLSDGYILLIGVNLTRCTAIHLAEFMANVPYLEKTNVKVLTERNKFTKLYRYPQSSEYFNKVEKDAKHLFNKVRYNGNVMTYFRLRPVIDFILKKLKKDTNYLVTP